MKRVLFFLVASLAVAVGASADIPAGYYDSALGKKDAELKSAMHEIIAPHTRIDYGAKGTWVVFRSSDVRPDGSIWDMYSDVVRYFPESGSHSEMHIEHSVPKSWWGEQSTFVYEASFDLHHLVPSDASTNMSKSNNILGVVESATFDNGVSKTGRATIGETELSVFEPADEYKGDFARMYMYVATCYQDYEWESDGVYMFSSEDYPTLNSYSQELLMSWHRQDPVSEKEVNRNEAVYAAQANRNPFIDFPLLPEYLWGDSIGRPFTAQLVEAPHMLTPKQGDKIDMGAVMSGSTLTYDVPVQGKYIASPLQLSWRVGSGIELSATTLTAQDVNAGTQVTLSYSSTNLTDVLRDTLIISGGGLSSSITLPVELRGTASFIPLSPIEVDATSATLRWVAMPQALSYSVELYKGASQATDLFISAYVEGSSYNKAIALYNGTNKTLNMSDYALGRQHNGVGEFVDYWQLPNANLAPGETYILVNSQCSDETLRGYADSYLPASEISPLNFNGNDAVALYHNSILIDVVGEFGSVEDWGKDVTLYRSHATLGPSVQYNAAQWTQAATDDFTLLRSHEMTATTPSPELVSTIDTDEVTADVTGLSPEEVYVYHVTALLSGGEQEGLYPALFTTDKLSTPTGVTTEQVHAAGFTLLWNEVADAEGYEVDCFRLVGSGVTTVSEHFDSVGSNGKPLPDGWSGTASGNYTSEASSGQTPPSVGLKSDGEYLQTPTFDAPITELSFLYRFASSATGSTLEVSYMTHGEWMVYETIPYENTKKTTRTYTFDSDEQVQALKWTYNKVSGNMAIDDVSITYGLLDTVYVVKEQYAATPKMVFYPLQSPCDFYYRVRAAHGTSRSEWSAVGIVATDPAVTVVDAAEKLSVTYTKTPSGVTLMGLSEGSSVEVYDMQGRLCHSRLTNLSKYNINLDQKGVYLIKIVNKDDFSVIKVAY